MRYYFTHSSEAGNGHAGSVRVSIFPEEQWSLYGSLGGTGRETYLADTAEEAVRGLDVLTVAAGVVWRVRDYLGVRLDYEFEDLDGVPTRSMASESASSSTSRASVPELAYSLVLVVVAAMSGLIGLVFVLMIVQRVLTSLMSGYAQGRERVLSRILRALESSDGLAPLRHVLRPFDRVVVRRLLLRLALDLRGEESQAIAELYLELGLLDDELQVLRPGAPDAAPRRRPISRPCACRASSASSSGRSTIPSGGCGSP